MKDIDKKYKVLVAHPGQQHSYRLATALEKSCLLFRYITTVYYKKNSLTFFLTKLINGKNKNRATNRKCNYLSDEKIILYYEILGLFTLLLVRVDKSKKVYRIWNDFVNTIFGKKIAYFAIKNNVDAVIVYDTCAEKIFEILLKKAPHIKRIMDVSAINRVYMKDVYEKDFARCEKFSNKLFKEREFLWNEKKLNSFAREISFTNYFIVPSNIVKQSLICSGIDENKIYSCEYGANLFGKNKEIEQSKKINTPLKIVYAGNVSAMKGIYYLLEAVKKYSKEEVQLNLAGNYSNEDGIFNEYLERNNFLGLLTKKELADLYTNSDLMIFPSLGDSFGLVVLEAMKFSIPVICSLNAGAADIIEDGCNGFKIEAGSKEQIIEKIDWALNNRKELIEMGKNASKTAETFTWESYEKKIDMCIRDILIK